MSSFWSLSFCFWNSVRLPGVVHHQKAFRTLRHFSTQKKQPLLHSGCARESQGDRGPETDECGLSGESDANPLLVHKAHKNPAPQSKFWQNLRTKTAASNEEEFRNLRNDDFPEKKGKRLQKPLPVERSRGSEILFGLAPCSLALERSKRNFFQLFLKSSRNGVSPKLAEFSQLVKERGIPIRMVRRNVLDRLCQGGVHQGLCLEASPLRPISWQEGVSLETEAATPAQGSPLLWLILEGILDPMNLGAVLRSAHFLGVDRIVMSEKNSCPLTPVVSKASSGAMEVLDVFSTDNLPSLLQAKSEQGWEILGTVGHGKSEGGIPVVNCLDFRWTRPTVLILGNEGYGLSAKTRQFCQQMLTIFPGTELPTGIESLNVSVAAGILLHSIRSQKIKIQ